MNRLLMFSFVAILTLTSLGCARNRLFGCFDREEEQYQQPCCCPTGCNTGYEGAMVMPSAPGTIPMIPTLPGPTGGIN